MNKKELFDTIIRKNLEAKGYGPFGYVFTKKTSETTAELKYYPNHYTNAAFDIFKLEMALCHPKHNTSYSKGKGSELLETTAPPKMASCASSSRFAYLALRNGAEAIGGSSVEFEYECKIDEIKSGNAPQLDAYTTDKDGNHIYIEAKCHEIFDSHKKTLSMSYKHILFGENNAFEFNEKDMLTIIEEDIEKIKVPYNLLGVNEDSMMDVKQFLCHLMGIACRQKKSKPATLYYMFFKPEVIYGNEDDQTFIDEVFGKLKKEVDALFKSKPISNFCKNHKINLKMFVLESAIMEKLPSDIKPLVDVPHK